MKFLAFSQTKLGSSFVITPTRVGGASVYPLLSSFVFSFPPTPFLFALLLYELRPIFFGGVKIKNNSV